MEPILNEQEGRLYCLKRQLARSARSSSYDPPTRAKLISEIKSLEKDMGLRASEEPKVFMALVGSPQCPAR